MDAAAGPRDPAPGTPREAISNAIPDPVVRGVGRIIPRGVDPDSIPLPEMTPIEAGPNARPGEAADERR